MSNNDVLKELFAQRLIEVRETRKLSQTELARLANLQPAAIGHFEKRRRTPSFANIRALAKALGVSADYLLGRTDTYEAATTAFRDEDKLSTADRDHIQMMIDLMNQRRKGE